MSCLVSFACNDENGQFTGKAERVQIGDLSLECRMLYGGVMIQPIDDRQLKLGRLLLSHCGYKYGVGNWCWDGYWLPDEEILRLINYLMRLKYWHCEEAPTEQFVKFNDHIPFSQADLDFVAITEFKRPDPKTTLPT